MRLLKLAFIAALVVQISACLFTESDRKWAREKAVYRCTKMEFLPGSVPRRGSPNRFLNCLLVFIIDETDGKPRERRSVPNFDGSDMGFNGDVYVSATVGQMLVLESESSIQLTLEYQLTGDSVVSVQILEVKKSPTEDMRVRREAVEAHESLQVDMQDIGIWDIPKSCSFDGSCIFSGEISEDNEGSHVRIRRIPRRKGGNKGGTRNTGGGTSNTGGGTSNTGGGTSNTGGGIRNTGGGTSNTGGGSAGQGSTVGNSGVTGASGNSNQGGTTPSGATGSTNQGSSSSTSGSVKGDSDSSSGTSNPKNSGSVKGEIENSGASNNLTPSGSVHGQNATGLNKGSKPRGNNVTLSNSTSTNDNSDGKRKKDGDMDAEAIADRIPGADGLPQESVNTDSSPNENPLISSTNAGSSTPATPLGSSKSTETPGFSSTTPPTNSGKRNHHVPLPTQPQTPHIIGGKDINAPTLIDKFKHGVASHIWQITAGVVTMATIVLGCVCRYFQIITNFCCGRSPNGDAGTVTFTRGTTMD